MAFPVTCPSCGKAFQLASDIYERKVAGKVVSIKCKQCQSGIRVDATVPGQLKVLGTTPASAGTDSTRPRAPSIADAEPAMRARQPTLLGMTAPSSPSATKSSPSEPLWAVDSAGAGEDRELNDEQIAEEIASGKLPGSTLVWREGFGDWLEIAQVPQLAQHLPSAKKPAPLPPRVPAAAKSAPLNPTPAAKSAPLNPTPAAKSAPLNPTAVAKAAPAPAAPKAALPKAAPLAAKAAPAAKAPVVAPKAAEPKAPPRVPQRSAPQIALPESEEEDLGMDDDESTMIYRAPTDMVAKLIAEENEKAAAPPPAAGRPAFAKPGPAPKAAPPLPPAPPPAAAALPAAPPLPVAAQPAAPPPPPLPSRTAQPPAPTFSEEPAAPVISAQPAPVISAQPAPVISAQPAPVISAQPFPPLSAVPIAARPLDPAIPVKGLEFPPAPRVPQGAMPQQGVAPFGAPTPGVTPTTAPPGMGMLAPNPFATLPTTTDLEFPAKRSKLPYVIAALLGVAAVVGVIAVMTTTKAPPPVPVPVAVPTTAPTTAVPAAQTATTADSPPTGPRDPIAAPSGSSGSSTSGNFSQMFAAGVENAEKTGGVVTASSPFDPEVAKKALLAQLMKVAACKEAGSPLGQTSAAVTFESSGKVSSVTVGAPFAGTSTGTCMVTAFKQVEIAPFTGLPGTVSQIVSLR